MPLLCTNFMKYCGDGIDTDNRGIVTFEKLKSGFAGFGSKISEIKVRQSMNAVDVERNVVHSIF